MPLSKARMRERKRLDRAKCQTYVKPKIVESVISGSDITPIYDPSKHGTGDKVRFPFNGKYRVIVIPELDADGNPMWDL